jgi:hypothetical protein
MDGHLTGGLDSELYGIPVNRYHDDVDVIPDDDRLIEFSAEDQHTAPSMADRKGG